jgi:hypothetical protein
MKLQLNPSVAAPGTTRSGDTGQVSRGAAPEGRFTEPSAAARDGVLISSASAVLNDLSAERGGKIGQLTALIQGGSYRTSSTATSHALIEDALSARN